MKIKIKNPSELADIVCSQIEIEEPGIKTLAEKLDLDSVAEKIAEKVTGLIEDRQDDLMDLDSAEFSIDWQNRIVLECLNLCADNLYPYISDMALEVLNEAVKNTIEALTLQAVSEIQVTFEKVPEEVSEDLKELGESYV